MKDNQINYVEFKAQDLESIKTFYSAAFNWNFTDYGPSYIAFSESGLEGGFAQSDDKINNGALVVLFHSKLEEIKDKIMACKGIISQDIISFPGGRRFHFIDPAGNELGVWSDK